MSAPRGAPGAVNVSTSTAKHRQQNAPGNYCGPEKAAHHTSSLGIWLLMAVIVVDVLRQSQVRHTARWFFGGWGLHEKASGCRLRRMDGVVSRGSSGRGGFGCATDAIESAQSRVAVLWR